MYVQTNKYSYICMYLHTYLHIQMYVHKTYIHMYVCTYTRTNAYTHKCRRKHTHTHPFIITNVCLFLCVTQLYLACMELTFFIWSSIPTRWFVDSFLNSSGRWIMFCLITCVKNQSHLFFCQVLINLMLFYRQCNCISSSLTRTPIMTK